MWVMRQIHTCHHVYRVGNQIIHAAGCLLADSYSTPQAYQLESDAIRYSLIYTPTTEYQSPLEVAVEVRA